MEAEVGYEYEHATGYYISAYNNVRASGTGHIKQILGASDQQLRQNSTAIGANLSASTRKPCRGPRHSAAGALGHRLLVGTSINV